METPDGAGTIISVNTLRETCRVRLDSAPDSLSTYHNSELRVVRNGKGKRPEGYVEPPKAELEKLRRPPDPGTEPSTSQLASALDQYMSTYQALEEAGSPAQPAGTHERGGEGNRRRHHRSSRSRGGKGDKPPERRDGKKGRSHWRRRGGGRRKPPMD